MQKVCEQTLFDVTMRDAEVVQADDLGKWWCRRDELGAYAIPSLQGVTVAKY